MAVQRAIELGQPFDLELPMTTARGRSVWVRAVGDLERDAAGQPLRLVGACQDITEQRQLQASLQHQTGTLSSVIEAIPAMVAVLDSELRLQLVNRSFERWRGLQREQLIGRSAIELFGAAEYERSGPMARRALAGETVSYEKEYTGAGEPRHVSVTYVPLRLPDGAIGGLIAVAHDISLHRAEQRRLTGLAEHDPLTGVCNRAGLKAFVDACSAAGEARGLALVYIDLDKFKPVNDTHGHPVGDELLTQFAQRLQRLVRPSDAVARLGGDEFALVLRNLRQRSDVEAVAAKVRDAAAMPFHVGARVVTVGASTGVALDASGADGLAGLLARADAALYRGRADRMHAA